MSNALKMLYIERERRKARKILLFGDTAAAARFQAQGWHARALRAFQIELYVVELPLAIRDRITRAQARQYR
jgi:hypothetical protein